MRQAFSRTLFLIALLAPNLIAADEARSKSLFDGKTFAGWEGDTKNTWRIEDGAIVGGSLKVRVPRNEFLCTTKSYGDFELKVKFKLLGDRKTANGGVQFRTKRIPKHHEVIGYQADAGQHYWGALYDESRRKKVLAGPDKKLIEKVVKHDDWNDYTIRCEGPRIRLWLNGTLTVDYTEKDDKIERTGIIGLQVHGGAKTKVLYKDIQIEELRPISAEKQAKPIDKGQRVFVCGHSFHVFIDGPLAEMPKAAGIEGHKRVGMQFLGGSRTLRHWNLADEKNRAKKALKTGEVDVLTLSPIQQPDEGVDNFVKLALKHNPNVRVTVQASWAAWDNDNTRFPSGARDKVDRNKTPKELEKIHAAYFKSVADQVAALNKEHGKPVVFVVPVGQAVVALRSKIHAGKAAGLKSQADLFSDAIGHGTAPLQALVAYCHFAVIYRRSPVGLPMPSVLKKAKKPDWNDDLNRILQEAAWEAVTSHPLSGVKKPAGKQKGDKVP